MHVCVCVFVKNGMLATCSLMSIFFFPHSKIPSYVLGNEKHSLQQYNEAMIIKTGYVGNIFLLPHYSIHLNKI